MAIEASVEGAVLGVAALALSPRLPAGCRPCAGGAVRGEGPTASTSVKEVQRFACLAFVVADGYAARSVSPVYLGDVVVHAVFVPAWIQPWR